MSYLGVDGYSDKKGRGYWGTDRLNRMINEKNLEKERGSLILMPSVPADVKSVIDLGCGIGRRHIHFPGLDYVGVDREEIMIENGKKEFPDLELYCGELMELSEMFPQFKEAFDMAFTFHVVAYNHSFQQQEIFKNIYNIIRPQGYYYMKENEQDCPRERVPLDKFEEIIHGPHGHTLFRKK